MKISLIFLLAAAIATISFIASSKGGEEEKSERQAAIDSCKESFYREFRK